MKYAKYFVLLAVLFCAPVMKAQTVRVNWQTGAPFGTYKSFSWRDPQKPGLPFYGAWVKSDVVAALSGKGLTQAAAGQSGDLVATYQIQGQEMIDADTTSDGFGTSIGPWGGGWGYWGGWGGWDTFDDSSTSFTSEHPRQIVLLKVSLFDAKTKQLVWMGQATVENVSSSEKGDQKQTEQCVQKMFKSYPPKVKK